MSLKYNPSIFRDWIDASRKIYEELNALYTFAGSGVSTVSVTSPILNNGTTQDPVIALLSNVAGGVPILDGNARISPSALPISAMEYKEAWNANTNTPALSSGSGTNGDVYRVSVAGSTNLDGITDWEVGDWLIFSGTAGAWQQIKSDTLQDLQSVLNVGSVGSINTDVIIASTNGSVFDAEQGIVFGSDKMEIFLRSASPAFWKQFYFDDTTWIVTDRLNDQGMRYENDYSVNGIANYGDRWIPDYGAVKSYADLVSTPFKYNLEYHVDPVNGNDSDDGSEGSPFLTVAHALATIPFGSVLILHAGVYNENVTITGGNIDIKGTSSKSSIVQFAGSFTVDNLGASSLRLKNIRFDDLIINGNSSVYLIECDLRQVNVDGVSSKYVELFNTYLQNLTIADGDTRFIAYDSSIQTVVANQNILTYPSSYTYFKDCSSIVGVVISNGLGIVENCTVFDNGTGIGVTGLGVASSLYFVNSAVVNGSVAGIVNGVNYSFRNTTVDLPNSTLTGVDVSTNNDSVFSNIVLNNPDTVNQGIIGYDANGKLGIADPSLFLPGGSQTQLLKNTNPLVYNNADPGQPDPFSLEGWNYTNPGGPATLLNPNKINWYFYDGNVGNKTLADVNFIYNIISFYNTNSLPFFQIYTKPLNDGNDAGSWYRSRLTYETYSVAPGTGTLYLTYINNDPVSKYPTLPRIELQFTSGVGLQDPSEEILTIAFGSNSAAPAGDVNFTLRNFGYDGGGAGLDFILDAETILPRQRVERTLTGDGNQTVFNVVHANGNLKPFATAVYDDLGNLVTIERVTPGNNTVEIEILPAIPLNVDYELKLLF